VPPAPIRALRDLTRLRITLLQDRARYRNRIQDVLEDACIKVSDKNDGPTDLFGVSGRAMLDALAAGQRDPQAPADLARGRMRTKIPTLIAALDGRFTDHRGHKIAMLLDLHDALSARIEELTTRIEAAIAAIDPTPPPDPDHPGRIPLLDRLGEIPGVGRDTAHAIVAEIGVDMSALPR
jgi:transposase